MLMNRIQWPFVDPNMLGALLASFSVVAFILCMKLSSKSIVALGGTLALVFGVMVVLTQSRAAVISAFLVMTFCYALSDKKRRIWGIILIGSFGVGIVVLGLLRPENVMAAGGSINTRIEIYSHAHDLIGGAPWGTVDSGLTSGEFYSRYIYSGSVDGLSLSTLVNSHLDALVTHGWVLGSIMMGCLALAWVCALVSFRRDSLLLQLVAGVFLCLFLCGLSSHIFRSLVLYGAFLATIGILVAYASTIMAPGFVAVLPVGTGLWYLFSVILGNMTPFRLLGSELSVVGADPKGPSVTVRDGLRWGNMGREIRRSIPLMAGLRIQRQGSGMASWRVHGNESFEGVTFHFDDGQSPLRPLHNAETQVFISGTLLRKHHFRANDAASMGYVVQSIPDVGSYYVSWFQHVFPSLAEYTRDNR